MPPRQHPSWEEMMKDDLDDLDVEGARAELSDALRGRGPLPWVIALGAIVLFLMFSPR
jgi:hypothetical protein